jgi:16S rRNA G966 N2-methylase RsmD
MSAKPIPSNLVEASLDNPKAEDDSPTQREVKQSFFNAHRGKIVNFAFVTLYFGAGAL